MTPDKWILLHPDVLDTNKSAFKMTGHHLVLENEIKIKPQKEHFPLPEIELQGFMGSVRMMTFASKRDALCSGSFWHSNGRLWTTSFLGYFGGKYFGTFPRIALNGVKLSTRVWLSCWSGRACVSPIVSCLPFHCQLLGLFYFAWSFCPVISCFILK